MSGEFIWSSVIGRQKPTYLPFYDEAGALENAQSFPQAKEASATLFNKHVGSSWWWEELLSEGGRIDPTRS